MTKFHDKNLKKYFLPNIRYEKQSGLVNVYRESIPRPDFERFASRLDLRSSRFHVKISLDLLHFQVFWNLILITKMAFLK